MEPWTSFTWAAAALGAFAMSAFVTWGSIAYARRHGLVDLPGQRRSHASPTPRGGGIGIVAAVLAGNVALFLASAQDNSILMLSAAILCVAAVGWKILFSVVK